MEVEAVKIEEVSLIRDNVNIEAFLSRDVDPSLSEFTKQCGRSSTQVF